MEGKMKKYETETEKKGEKGSHGVVMMLRRKGIKSEPSKTQYLCTFFCYLKHISLYRLMEQDSLL